MPLRIGIDIGGAFTDLIAYDEESGNLVWTKVETTPKDLSQGVLNSINASGVKLSNVSMIIHGQTLVINSIVTKEGAKVGLMTTWGHRDILELQRANRRDIYNFRYKKPVPFVPRRLSLEIGERIGGDGSIIVPLNSEDVKSAIEKFLQEGVESICVSFLNSYINPVHEIEATKIIKEVLNSKGKQLYITLSHEITREWGEYERTSTAVLNAFVKPKWVSYLSKLEKEIKEKGFRGSFLLMLSNGGMSLVSFIKEFPIYTVESGPVAGIIGGIAIAEFLNEKNIIVLDGGSTTTKAALIEGLMPIISNEYYIGRDRFNPGYPVKIPIIEIAEVGNGGTSIAWIDEIGRLKVGPKAMGADPGPACYGKGGDKPTVTDAYVVNRLINPNYLLGGEMKIYRDLAIKVIKNIAEYYNVSIEEAAEGIIKIANENAANVIRLISVQKGYDPRDFSLIAHGGAGPMFAPFIAEELEIRKIIVPAIPPGVFSAWGMLLADVKHDVIITNVMEVKNDVIENMNKTFEEVDKKLLAIFEEENFKAKDVIIYHYADMRYKGQEHTVKVPLKTGEIKQEDIPLIIEKFHEYHERAYAFRLPTSPVQIVNFHGIGVAKVKRPSLKEKIIDTKIDEAVKETRDVYINGDYKTLLVYDKEKIPTNVKLIGPAVIEDPTSTILVLANQEFFKDKYGNIIIYKR
jgi:N-methylhydantoinase A